MTEAHSRKLELSAGLHKDTFMKRLARREQAAGIVPARQLYTAEDRSRQYDRFEAMIGTTRLLPLHLNNGSTIWRKMESDNPTGSHYDRAAIKVLRRLETEGFIKPGDTILEGTSGSAGRSFAYFCNRLGYPLDMVIPLESEFPQERLQSILDLGAHPIRADKEGGMVRVVEKFKSTFVDLIQSGYKVQKYQIEGKPLFKLTKGDHTICIPNHSEVIMTPRAFEAIAEETLAQLPEGVRIDTFIGTLGNGSTMKGTTDMLRNEYGKSNVTIIGTEYKSSPTNAIKKLRLEVGEENLRKAFLFRYGFRMPEADEQQYHTSFGASTPGYEPPFVEVEKIDKIVIIGDEWQRLKRRHNTTALQLGRIENTLGNTSAENLYVALQYAELHPGSNTLVFNYDNADQYHDYPPELVDHVYPLPQRTEPREEILFSLRQKAA